MACRGVRFASLTALCCCWLVHYGAAVRAADREPKAVTAPETAAELPNFKPGLWEYTRTVVNGQSPKPQVLTVHKCTDPTADIRNRMAVLKSKNCQFTPLRRKQDHYLSEWTCPTPNGPTRFHDALIVKDATRYQDTSEIYTAQRVSQQKIEATRVGDCPATGSGAPLTPSPTLTPAPKPHL